MRRRPPCDEPRGWRRVGVARYLRARLQRRIFAWFGVAILLTTLVAFGVSSLVGEGPGWNRELEGVRALVSEQFGSVWGDPGARDDLARRISEHLRLGLSLTDAAGKPLGTFGGVCIDEPYTTEVHRDGQHLGTVHVCFDERRAHHASGLLMVFAAISVLWAFSRVIAKRLSRPLAELARVAEELGAGKLDARAEIRHGTGEVAVVASAINEMATRIQRQLADQRELLATVSHELRTPLARIRLLVELLRDGAESPHLEEIDGEAVAIDDLVAELLASSRIDFAALTTTKVVLREAAERALTRADLDIKILVDRSNSAAISADPTLIARALANLLNNAARHGGGAKALIIEALAGEGEEEGRIKVFVEDFGPGLPRGEEERIFEPFYRSHGNKDQGSPGLGLALVRRIARAHGGDAFAENRAEGGARVGFYVARGA